EPHVDAFLGSIGSPDHPPVVGAHQLSDTCPADLPTRRPTTLDHDNHRAARLPSCVTPVNTLTYYALRSPPQPNTPTRRRKRSLGRLVSYASIWAVLRRYGNINPLSIDYACRPRLRSRLT